MIWVDKGKTKDKNEQSWAFWGGINIYTLGFRIGIISLRPQRTIWDSIGRGKSYYGEFWKEHNWFREGRKEEKVRDGDM